MIESISLKIARGIRLTDGEVVDLACWFTQCESMRGTLEWAMMGGDDARAWSHDKAGELEPDWQTKAVPAKYEHIDFKPTESMAEAAQQGLDYRDEYGRGGTDVGIARARDIANRRNLSPETVGRMASFFARHAENRNPDAEESDGGPSNGWIAWLLWGGDPGKAWADKVMGQMKAADDKLKQKEPNGQDHSSGTSDDGGGSPGQVHQGRPALREVRGLAGSRGLVDGGGDAPQPDGHAELCAGCDAVKSGASGANAGGCQCGCSHGKALATDHPDTPYMPVTFRGYYKAPADPDDGGDATDTVRDGEELTPIQRLARDVQAVLDAQADAVLSVLGVSKGKAKPRRKATERDLARALAMLDDDALAKAIEDALANIMLTGSVTGLERLGLSVDDMGELLGTLGPRNPLVAEAARRQAGRIANAVNETTRQAISNAVGDGLEASESTAKIAERVRGVFDANPARSETIARTESATAYEEGEQLAWEQTGVVEGKQWLLAPGACPYCEAVAKQFEGKTVALADSFFDQGSKIQTASGTMTLDYRDIKGPPLHPNDRCGLVPVLIDDVKALQDLVTKGDTDGARSFWTKAGGFQGVRKAIPAVRERGEPGGPDRPVQGSPTPGPARAATGGADGSSDGLQTGEGR